MFISFKDSLHHHENEERIRLATWCYLVNKPTRDTSEYDLKENCNGSPEMLYNIASCNTENYAPF